MGKRGNERQITKDDYDDDDDRNDNSAAALGLGPNQHIASAAVMKNRRIVRVCAPPKSSTGGGTGGIFSRVSLKPSSSAPNVSFGKPLSASSPAPAFSFASKGSAPATGSFSFGSKIPGSSLPPAPSTATPSMSTPANSNGNDILAKLPTDWRLACRELDEAFLKRIRSFTASSSLMSLADCDRYLEFCHVQDYARYQEELKVLPAAEIANIVSPAPTPTTASNVSSSSSSSSNNAPPPLSQPPITLGTNMGSFAQQPSQNPSAARASLGAPKATPNTDGGANDGDDTNDNDDDPLAEAAPDPDWDTIETFDPVLMYRLNDQKEVVKFAKGDLQVQRHKTTAKKHRWVMRDIKGTRVLVNMVIGQFLQDELSLTEERSKGKSPTVRLTFMGCNDTKRGTEIFHLRTHTPLGKKLFGLVKGLSLSSD